MDRGEAEEKKNLEKIENLQLCLEKRTTEIEHRVMVKALKEVRMLCRQKVPVKVRSHKCNYCQKDEKYADSQCMLPQKCGCTDIFYHEECFIEFYNQTKTQCRKCQQSVQQQFQDLQKLNELLCQFCQKVVQEEDMLQGCDCLSRRAHNQCLHNQFIRGYSKADTFFCNYCKQCFRQGNVESVLNNYMYSCTKCSKENPYWESIFLSCSHYFCTMCFDIKGREKITPEKLTSLKCAKINCDYILNYQEIKSYLGMRMLDQSILSRYAPDLNIEECFKLIECPGYLAISRNKANNVRFFSKTTNTQIIMANKKCYKILNPFNDSYYNREYYFDLNSYNFRDQSVFAQKIQGEISLHKPNLELERSNEWILTKCSSKYHLKNDQLQYICTNCNYSFCSNCQIGHYNIPCEIFQSIIKKEHLTQETMLSLTQFGQRREIINQLVIDLQISLNIYDFNQIKRNPLQAKNAQTQSSILINYPSEVFHSIKLQINPKSNHISPNNTNIPFLFFPITSLQHLRNSILFGIDLSYMLPINIRKIDRLYQMQTAVLYSDYQLALKKASYFESTDHLQIKVLLFCKIKIKSKLPQDTSVFYFRTPQDIQPHKIMVFVKS